MSHCELHFQCIALLVLSVLGWYKSTDIRGRNFWPYPTDHLHWIYYQFRVDFSSQQHIYIRNYPMWFNQLTEWCIQLSFWSISNKQYLWIKHYSSSGYFDRPNFSCHYQYCKFIAPSNEFLSEFPFCFSDKFPVNILQLKVRLGKLAKWTMKKLKNIRTNNWQYRRHCIYVWIHLHRGFNYTFVTKRCY